MEDFIMSFEFIKKLPTPDQIREEYPVPASMQELKKKRDAEISDVFTGASDKFIKMPSANMFLGLPKLTKR